MFNEQTVTFELLSSVSLALFSSVMTPSLLPCLLILNRPEVFSISLNKYLQGCLIFFLIVGPVIAIIITIVG